MRLFRFFCIQVFFLAQLLVISLALATDATLSELTIQTAIEDRGFSWTARENNVTPTYEPELEVITVLNGSSARLDDGAGLWNPRSPVSPLPDSLDWRNVRDQNWVESGSEPDPQDSGHLTTTLRNIGDLACIAQGDPSRILNLTAGSLEPASSFSQLSLTEIQDYLVLFGASTNGHEPTYLLDSWEWVTREETDVETIKQAVLKGPVLTTMRLFEDFLFYAGGVYESLGLNYIGLILVRIIGWENATESWIVQNTWGEDWGEDGCARVYWDDPISRIGRFSIIHHLSTTENFTSGLETPFTGGDVESEPRVVGTKRPITFLEKKDGGAAASVGHAEYIRSLNESPVTIPSTSVILEWDPSANASWYQLELNTDPNWGEATRVFYGNIGPDPTKSFQGLEEHVRYYWRVWAGNEAESSEPAVGPSFLLEAATSVPSMATITNVVSGTYRQLGKGKNRVSTFVTTDTLKAGETFVLKLYVSEKTTGSPVSNAILDMSIQGPSTALKLSMSSDVNGLATFTWKTSAPNKKGLNGTTPGAYSATVKNVQSPDYVWDGGIVNVMFSVQ
ncbi:MAG: hypothetical protein HY788_11525 [Deltaproteobacteria bacterium]|nr:hypothetical protein [Deltaproteobacteria bacterium]